MMKTEHVLQMLWYSILLIRRYANKTSETKMAQMDALAVDSSGIAPHMGDDHGCLQSYVLYIHIPTYADNYHSRITLWGVQSTWPTDASPSPYLIYSFSFILSPQPNFTHITGARMIGPLPLPTTVGFIYQKAVKWSCLTKHTPLNWHLSPLVTPRSKFCRKPICFTTSCPLMSISICFNYPPELDLKDSKAWKPWD